MRETSTDSFVWRAREDRWQGWEKEIIYSDCRCTWKWGMRCIKYGILGESEIRREEEVTRGHFLILRLILHFGINETWDYVFIIYIYHKKQFSRIRLILFNEICSINYYCCISLFAFHKNNCTFLLTLCILKVSFFPQF